MVVHADALANRLGAVHLAARGPAVAMDEPEVRDASWTRARDQSRADGRADGEDAFLTASESDWSDAELREADSGGDSDKPPSAAQGSGRPWAHVSRARAARRRELRAAAAMAAAPPPPRELTESGAGVFLADLDASAAIHVLSHLSPVERARVAAVRRSERAALKSPDIVVEDDPALTTSSADYYDGVVYGSSPSSPPLALSSSPTPQASNRAQPLRREPRWSSGRLSMGARTHVEGGGHLADAAWREIDLRGAATPAALCTLRGVACGAVRALDVTGSRLAKRGDILDLARESPQLRELRCCALGDNGKWSVRDVDAVFEHCPSLTLFECDVGVKIDSLNGEERYEESLGEVRYVLGDRRMRIRRVKIHSGCADSAHVVFECAARAARAGRLRSADASWSLKLGCGAARGCAAMMEKHGGGWPLQRLAMRKANIKDPGAMSLAGAIRRAADAVAAKDKEAKRKEWSGRYEGRGEGHVGADSIAESPYGDVDPVCELRWLDLGSNHVNDPGAAALGDALGPNVPMTRLNLRDNHVGVLGCRSIGLGVVRCGATLRRLDLAHNGFGCQGAVALAGALAAAHSPCALKVLQLGFNSIGADGAKALAAALTSGNFSRLEHLDLACNVLGPDGVAALAPLLDPIHTDDLDESDEADDGASSSDKSDEKRVAGLYSLDLAVNNAGGDCERGGIRALMKALERNTSLRMLNLRGNDLTPEHAGDVAEMLCENVTLTQLNVGYNKIYNEGAWELAEALSENPSLLGLDIQRNEISDDGAEWIRGLLAANSIIEEVDMRSNQLSPEVVESFGKSFGERVNARWQQEPPKVEKNDENMATQRTMVGEGGGRVAAKKAERAARKAARRAARGR